MTQTFRSHALVAINQIIQPAIRTVLSLAMTGKLNVLGSVTLTANSATTTLTDDLIDDSSAIFLAPRTANAKAEGIPYYDNPTAGSVVLNHANNAQTDRTYDYGVIG